MRAVLLIILTVAPAAVHAQTIPPSPFSEWDVAVLVGSFNTRRDDMTRERYADRWVQTGEVAVTAARYWSPHLKTEVSFAGTGEPSRYIHTYTTISGIASPVYYSTVEHARTREAAAVVHWQFLENQWAHPFLFAGVAVDWTRVWSFRHEQSYSTGDPRLPDSRQIVIPAVTSPAITTLSGRALVGGGGKLYVAPRVFMRTDALIGIGGEGAQFRMRAGLGFDF